MMALSTPSAPVCIARATVPVERHTGQAVGSSLDSSEMDIDCQTPIWKVGRPMGKRWSREAGIAHSCWGRLVSDRSQGSKWRCRANVKSQSKIVMLKEQMRADESGGGREQEDESDGGQNNGGRERRGLKDKSESEND